MEHHLSTVLKFCPMGYYLHNEMGYYSFTEQVMSLQ